MLHPDTLPRLKRMLASNCSFILVVAGLLGCKESAPGTPPPGVRGEAAGRYNACYAGDAEECGKLGTMYVEGREVEKDPVKAAGLYQKGCTGGDPASCSGLGSAYHLGVGVDADQAKAVALFTRACDRDFATGCSNLGVMYERGTGAA